MRIVCGKSFAALTLDLTCNKTLGQIKFGRNQDLTIIHRSYSDEKDSCLNFSTKKELSRHVDLSKTRKSAVLTTIRIATIIKSNFSEWERQMTEQYRFQMID